MKTNQFKTNQHNQQAPRWHAVFHQIKAWAKTRLGISVLISFFVILILVAGWRTIAAQWETDFALRQKVLRNLPKSSTQTEAEQNFPNIGFEPARSFYEGYPCVKDYLKYNLGNTKEIKFLEWSAPRPVTYFNGNYWAIDAKLETPNTLGEKQNKIVTFYTKNDFVFAMEDSSK